jgi:hypothetical protein
MPQRHTTSHYVIKSGQSAVKVNIVDQYVTALHFYAMAGGNTYALFARHFGRDLIGHEPEFVQAIKTVFPAESVYRRKAISRMMRQIRQMQKLEDLLNNQVNF